ncbi:hypothetical protein MP478_04405 [Chryseobacterium sp. WG14]|uniref:hypothetical protein n=1 Tax=Chryseobacterium sp. WG14 TaxID=2926909 RepID=UPI00211E8DBF|nr:hypothetical protein [Chryseobacterium sp. WG14]MCQ9638622.1 hypothetical protein [Chryseobacterium sp. WG14]
MKPQELRIGNLVYIPSTDQTLPITAINMDIGVWVNRSLGVLGFDQISPIELTEEWLIKFGFKHTGGGFYTHLPSLIQMCNISDMFFQCGFKDESIGNMYFVHQLQNLYFALVGEELTIKE